MNYETYILSADEEIVRRVQSYCAAIHERGDDWSTGDAAQVAAFLNDSAKPSALFRFIDEKTGSHYVGYRTRDGREWFHILRQMRNEPGSGLLENLDYEKGRS